MSDQVRIVEVGPRDGLQNEKTPVSVAARIAFIEALVGAGLHTIEVGAFVSPRAVPQMVGSDLALRGVNHHPDSEFHAPVPTKRATTPRARAGARVIAVFASAIRRFFACQHQLLGRRIDRALQARREQSQGRRRQGARLHLLRIGLPL